MTTIPRDLSHANRKERRKARWMRGRAESVFAFLLPSVTFLASVRPRRPPTMRNARQTTDAATDQTDASGVPCHLTNSQSTPNAGALGASPKERRRICSLVRQPLIWRLRLVVGSCEETDYPTTFSQGVIYQTASTPKWKGFFLLSSARSFPPRGKNEQREVWKKRGKKQHSLLRSVEKVRWLCVVSSVEESACAVER